MSTLVLPLSASQSVDLRDYLQLQPGDVCHPTPRRPLNSILARYGEVILGFFSSDCMCMYDLLLCGELQ